MVGVLVRPNSPGAQILVITPPPPPGGGTPICGLYRYVPRDRVCFLRFSVLK